MQNTGKSSAFIMGLLTLSTTALSMTTTPSARFSGTYMGGTIGAVRGSSNYQTNPGCGAVGADAVFCNVSPDPSATNGVAVAASGTARMHPRGIAGGVQVGHNWQRDQLVIGGEVDFGALELNKSVHADGMFPFVFLGTRYGVTESISTDWLATARGRIGAAIRPQLLFYATGGAAFTNYRVASTYRDNAVDATFPGGSGYGSSSSNSAGWTAGCGGEWLLAEHFSIKAEYLYLDFGSTNVWVPTSNTPSYTQTIQVRADLNANLFRFGMNYQFG